MRGRHEKILFKSPEITIAEVTSKHYALNDNPVPYPLRELYQRILRDKSNQLSVATAIRLRAWYAGRHLKKQREQPKNLIERRALNAKLMLKLTHQRIKRLQTAKKRWKRKVKYYEKKKVNAAQ